jgi:hypothetical protein
MLLDGRDIVKFQGASESKTGPDSPEIHAPGADDKEIGPHAVESFLDSDLGPRADTDHGDHRANADDDSQGRQECAHLVPA